MGEVGDYSSGFSPSLEWHASTSDNQRLPPKNPEAAKNIAAVAKIVIKEIKNSALSDQEKIDLARFVFKRLSKLSDIEDVSKIATELTAVKFQMMGFKEIDSYVRETLVKINKATLSEERKHFLSNEVREEGKVFLENLLKGTIPKELTVQRMIQNLDKKFRAKVPGRVRYIEPNFIEKWHGGKIQRSQLDLEAEKLSTNFMNKALDFVNKSTLDPEERFHVTRVLHDEIIGLRAKYRQKMITFKDYRTSLKQLENRLPVLAQESTVGHIEGKLHSLIQKSDLPEMLKKQFIDFISHQIRNGRVNMPPKEFFNELPALLDDFIVLFSALKPHVADLKEFEAKLRGHISGSGLSEEEQSRLLDRLNEELYHFAHVVADEGVKTLAKNMEEVEATFLTKMVIDDFVQRSSVGPELHSYFSKLIDKKLQEVRAKYQSNPTDLKGYKAALRQLELSLPQIKEQVLQLEKLQNEVKEVIESAQLPELFLKHLRSCVDGQLQKEFEKTETALLIKAFPGLITYFKNIIEYMQSPELDMREFLSNLNTLIIESGLSRGEQTDLLNKLDEEMQQIAFFITTEEEGQSKLKERLQMVEATIGARLAAVEFIQVSKVGPEMRPYLKVLFENRLQAHSTAYRANKIDLKGYKKALKQIPASLEGLEAKILRYEAEEEELLNAIDDLGEVFRHKFVAYVENQREAVHGLDSLNKLLELAPELFPQIKSNIEYMLSPEIDSIGFELKLREAVTDSQLPERDKARLLSMLDFKIQQIVSLLTRDEEASSKLQDHLSEIEKALLKRMSDLQKMQKPK